MRSSKRIKKNNIDSMSKEEIDALSAKLGSKVRVLSDNFVNRINKTLKTYDMYAKIAIVIDKLPSEVSQSLAKNIQISKD